MRIAFFVNCFPAVSETFILRQITGLLDLGHEVHVFSQRRPDQQSLEIVHPELRTYNLASRTTYLDSEMPAASGYWCMPVWPITGETWLPGADQPIRNSDRILEAIPVLRGCLESAPELTISVLDPDQYGEQAISLEALYHLASLLAKSAEFDVIHAHFGPVANALRFARALWQAPLVATFHGYDFSAIPRQCGDAIYRHLFADADTIVAISEYAKCRLAELGCPLDKLVVLHTGVRPAEFPFGSRQREPGKPVRVLSVGRLVEKKGFEYALRAVALAHRKCPDLRYNIVGDGPLQPALEALIEKLQLTTVVTLCGAADGNFVRQQMASAHIFLLPSVTAADGDQEGIPVSLMEAQACGLPVVSTNHSGIPELILDGETGFLAPERDSETLAERLLFLLEHPEVWPRMGQEGRKTVERGFNMDVLNRELIQIYQRAISQFHRSGQSMATLNGAK